jgi:periplasmic protein TonB
MFESLVTQNRQRGRFGAGTAVSLVMHVSIVLIAAFLAKHATTVATREVEVMLVRRPSTLPPPPPPPPPAARRPTQSKVKPKPHPVIAKKMVAPKVVPEAPPPEPPKEEPPEEEPGEEGGVEGGVVGGVQGGVVGGVVGMSPAPPPPPPPPPVRMEFNDSMTPPKVISGPNPEYTDQALEREVQGLMVVKCVVTVEGRVHDCRVLQSLPFMDRAVIGALEQRRYTPALLQGKPVEVDYTFRIRLTLPQ